MIAFFLLQGLGSKAGRGASVACGSDLLGPEPWTHPLGFGSSGAADDAEVLQSGPASIPPSPPPRHSSMHPPGVRVHWSLLEGGRLEYEATTFSGGQGGGGGRGGEGPSSVSVLALRPDPGTPQSDNPSLRGGPLSASAPLELGGWCGSASGDTGGGHGPRFATLLLHSPIPAMAEASEATVERCFRRLQSALLGVGGSAVEAGGKGWGTGGKVLPAMGVTELEAAAWLRRAAKESSPDLDLDIDPGSRRGGPPPAWAAVNAELAEDGAAYRGAVLEAVAEAMEDTVTTLLQVGHDAGVGGEGTR